MVESLKEYRLIASKFKITLSSEEGKGGGGIKCNKIRR